LLDNPGEKKAKIVIGWLQYFVAFVALMLAYNYFGSGIYLPRDQDNKTTGDDLATDQNDFVQDEIKMNKMMRLR
jgi:hypothetical protein